MLSINRNFCSKRIDQLRRLFGRKYTHRMGIKRENRRAHPKLPRPLNHGFQDQLMPDMEAIEITNRHHRRNGCRCIGQMGNHFHRGMIIRNDWCKVRKARWNHGQAAGTGRLSVGQATGSQLPETHAG